MQLLQKCKSAPAQKVAPEQKQQKDHNGTTQFVFSSLNLVIPDLLANTAADGMPPAVPLDDKDEDPQDIFAAAKIGDLEGVKAFAGKNGFEINKTIGTGIPRTAFSLACEHGHHNVVQYLLQRGADAERDNGEPTVIMTPILWAAKGGHIEVVNLLDEKVNPNCRSDSGMTPLLIASKNGHVGVVRKLVEHPDRDKNSTDSSGRTPLSIAAGDNHPDVVGYLFASADVVPDLCDSEGRTPLYFAAQAGHMSMCKLLASVAPATLNKTDNEGKTPLMAAAAEGCFEVVEWLLGQARVSPVSQDDNEWTALLHALQWRNIKVVRLLMHHDNIALHILTRQLPTAPLTAINHTPSHQLRWSQEISGQSQDYATALLSAGYDINTRDDKGITSLQSAARRRHYEAIVFLLRHNASMKGIMKYEWSEVLKSMFGLQNDEEATILVCKGHVERLSSASRGLADELKRDGDAGLILVRDATQWDDFYKVLFDCVLVPLSSIEPGTESPAAGAFRAFQHNLSDQPKFVVSMSFILPREDDVPQDNLYTRQKSIIRIAWTSSPRASGPSLYLSTMPYGWTPDNEFELFEQFIRKMEEAWAYTCSQAKHQLAEIRTSQLDSEGKSPELMNRIAKLAKKFAIYRAELEKQVTAARDFLTKYNSTYRRQAMVPESLKRLLEADLEQNIGGQIEKLDQNVRDVLQIEFAWASISETRISTRLSQNVMLLTYVSIFYLPLAYCAALWAIPNIMSATTKTPFITTSAAVAVITLLVAFNIESIVALMVWAYDKGRGRILKTMQEDDVDGKWRKRGNDLHFLNPRSATRSEWWLYWYLLVRGWRRITRSWKSAPHSGQDNAASSATSPATVQV